MNLSDKHAQRRGFGAFLGLASLVFLFIFLVPPVAVSQSESVTTYTETVLHSFSGAPNDGAIPTSGVILDAAGNMYGTTYYGGSPSNYGVVYEIDAAGNETILHTFTNNPDGANPFPSLLLDSQGNLYGTTPFGGLNNEGAVFQVTARGEETLLYSFGKPIGQGSASPYAGLAMDRAGNLYGTAASGFAGLYKLNPSSGDFTVLTSAAASSVLLDPMDDIYGTSYYGPICKSYCSGVVYEYTVAGRYVELFQFGGVFGSSENQPSLGTLVVDSQGNLYGTTVTAGPSGYGTVYKLTPSGIESVLYSFTGGLDGAFPFAGLAIDSSGNIYGTTYQGGAAKRGTVFRISANGTMTTLHHFGPSNGDGAYPMSALIEDASGNLYGTTQAGGAYGLGTVFKLKP